MKQIILGTAGHIDHGKTSLIKALTGTNTDRLKEEQVRGITIELGFASFDLPSGQHLGIVDVPGHEKFVKNMVAGATGIDLLAMVIAADEGVMPQTKEHMEICSLLGIKYGLIVLTKIDLVDEEWLELVTEDVKEFVNNTFLEKASIVYVSSTTNQGIPELIQKLDNLSAKIPERPPTTIFRLPVDRVFTMKGFGTVITGTLASGKISVGNSVMLYPSGITSKIRGIQVHNQSVETAFTGMRTAINFQGLDKDIVNRGDVLSVPDALKSTYMFDGYMLFLKSNKKPVKNRTRVRVHTGTKETIGNLILLDRDELVPGDSAVVQIRLESSITVIKDDKFVVRSYSPVRTIGGGSVLNPIPEKHKRFKKEIIETLINLIDYSPEELVDFHVLNSEYKGISLFELKVVINITESRLEKILQKFLSAKQIVLSDKEKRIYIHQTIFERLIDEINNYLVNYHKSYPLKEGAFKEELRSKFPSFLGQHFFNLTLSQMVKNNKVIQEDNIIRLATHKVALQVDQADIRQKIVDVYKNAKLTPPYFKAFVKEFDLNYNSAKDILMVLINEGGILKIKEDLYFYSEAIKTLEKELIQFLKTNKEISTPQFKDMTQVSRKYVIPLIEYFDSQNITIRVGDNRQLRKQN